MQENCMSVPIMNRYGKLFANEINTNEASVDLCEWNHSYVWILKSLTIPVYSLMNNCSTGTLLCSRPVCLILGCSSIIGTYSTVPFL